MSDFNPSKAFIFRIVHIENVPWIMEHGGLHCRNSSEQDANFINIGSSELIAKRAGRLVPIPPGGTLRDYVAFYFTPFSIMMFNIKTGYGGIKKRESREIVLFVSSIYRLRELNVPFVFTNQHAYAVDTEFYTDPQQLERIDWPLLQRRDFKTDDANPRKQLRYQAETLVYQKVPLAAILGVACHDDVVKQRLEATIQASGLNISVKPKPNWYF
jgi:hypothetical protein